MAIINTLLKELSLERCVLLGEPGWRWGGDGDEKFNSKSQVLPEKKKKKNSKVSSYSLSGNYEGSMYRNAEGKSTSAARAARHSQAIQKRAEATMWITDIKTHEHFAFPGSLCFCEIISGFCLSSL